MAEAELHILSTRPLPETLIDAAAQNGFRVDTISLIDTEPVTDEQLISEIKELALQPLQVVFTSMNAVEAVADVLPAPPAWTAWSIGETTRALLEEKLRIPVAGDAPDADRLADRIIAAGVPELTFFCGNIRRDTLPVKLRAAGIRLNERIVYRTSPTPKRAEQAYHGILFYSPSAVESYFSVNPRPTGAVLFAIGGTTAAAIREHFDGPVVVAASPGKEALLHLAMEHLRNFAPTK